MAVAGRHRLLQVRTEESRRLKAREEGAQCLQAGTERVGGSRLKRREFGDFRLRRGSSAVPDLDGENSAAAV